MDQEAFERAVEQELEDAFGYYKPGSIMQSSTPIPRITMQTRYKVIIYRPFYRRVYFFLIISFIFMVVLCLLYFIPEIGFFDIIIGVLELIIIISIIGVGLVVLYKKIKKTIEEKEIRQILKEMEEHEEKRQRLLETLRDINTELYKGSVDKDLSEIKEILKNHSTQEASKLLAKEDIRKRLCPALKSATDDVYDISKSVTPVLVGCVVAGTISIPLNPVLFAAIAVVIARMGISALCAGFITK